MCTAVHPEIIEYAPLHSGRRAPWNDRANAAASLSVLIATLLEGISSGSKLNVAVPKNQASHLRQPFVKRALASSTAGLRMGRDTLVGSRRSPVYLMISQPAVFRLGPIGRSSVR